MAWLLLLVAWWQSFHVTPIIHPHSHRSWECWEATNEKQVNQFYPSQKHFIYPISSSCLRTLGRNTHNGLICCYEAVTEIDFVLLRMLGGIRWHLVSVTHLTKLKWLALCKEERRLIECCTIEQIRDPAHFIHPCGDTDTRFRSQCDSVSWQQRWWANPVLLQQMSAASAARTDPGTAALQRVIISRVNPGCSALTSSVQLTAVINYPLCSNRNSFLASHWSEKPLWRLLIGQYPHIKEQHIPAERKNRMKNMTVEIGGNKLDYPQLYNWN